MGNVAKRKTLRVKPRLSMVLLFALTSCSDPWGMNPRPVDATDLNFYNVALDEIKTCLASSTNCSFAVPPPASAPINRRGWMKLCAANLESIQMTVSHQRRSLTLKCKIDESVFLVESYDDESVDQYDLITYMTVVE